MIAKILVVVAASLAVAVHGAGFVHDSVKDDIVELERLVSASKRPTVTATLSKHLERLRAKLAPPPGSASALHKAEVRGRSPQETNAKCPLAGPCHGAHDCSLSTARFAVPETPQLALTEFVRREEGSWGYWEYGAQRDLVRASSILKTDQLFNLSRPGTKIASFHILVGEGVNRATLEKGVRAAVASQDEIWLQEHHAGGKSWADRKSWPVGHPWNPPREPNSDMFTLEEVTARLHEWAADCPQFKPLQSCLIPTPQDPAGRNMQVGVRCRCNGCDSQFCRPWGSANLYHGPRFVYTAQADPPLDSRTLELADRSFGTYATVVGGMTGLDALVGERFEAKRIFFYDVNPWMIEFARLVVALVRQSQTRVDFVSHMLRKDLRATGVFPLSAEPPTEEMRRSAEEAARGAPQFSAPLDLTPAERCAYDWLLRSESQVCQQRDLFRDPARPPSIDPHRILRPTAKPHRTNNTCSFYYGYGWLASEATFARVKRSLAAATVIFTHYSIDAPLSDLVGKEPGPTLLFTSNVVAKAHVGSLHKRLEGVGFPLTHVYRGVGAVLPLYFQRSF